MGSKVIIYQLLLRAFGNRHCVPGGSWSENGSGRFNDVTPELLSKIRLLSANAIWFTGVISHATRTHFRNLADCNRSIVKGEAGSPYSINNYFDVDPALAVNIDNRMQEFQAMVDRTHKAGIKVIIDFVPNHVSREYHGEYFNKQNYYMLKGELHLPSELGSDYVENPARATGNDVFHCHPGINDWYDTVKLNYENRDTWVKMLDILLFWADKGVDGFRCDMAEMVPSAFFKWAFENVREKHPGTIFIAEVYDKNRYREYAEAGFDLLYDKSGFYDTLREIVTSGASAREITRRWQELGDLQPRMLNFLENHDEQRVASDFFAGNGRRGFAALAVSLLFNTAPFMIYFGQEFGERGMESEGFSGIDGRTSIFDYCTVPSVRRWIDNRLTLDESVVYKEYCRLMRIAVGDAIFASGKSYDLMYANPDSDDFNGDRQFAWMRGIDGTAMLIVANFDKVPVTVRVWIPEEAFAFFGIDTPGRFVTVKVNPCDYCRTDVSR